MHIYLCSFQHENFKKSQSFKMKSNSAQLVTIIFSFHSCNKKKEMATHSSTLAWKIPWMEEHCRLRSTGSQRVGHN